VGGRQQARHWKTEIVASSVDMLSGGRGRSTSPNAQQTVRQRRERGVHPSGESRASADPEAVGRIPIRPTRMGRSRSAQCCQEPTKDRDGDVTAIERAHVAEARQENGRSGGHEARVPLGPSIRILSLTKDH
jgi:hypothetical protein